MSHMKILQIGPPKVLVCHIRKDRITSQELTIFGFFFLLMDGYSQNFSVTEVGGKFSFFPKSEVEAY